MRISPRERLESLYDYGSYTLTPTPEPQVTDPLNFRDQKRYVDRLKEARRVTGETDAVLVGAWAHRRRRHGHRRAKLRFYGRLHGHRRGRRSADRG